MERYRETMSPAESIVRWNEVDEHSGADGLKRVGPYVLRALSVRVEEKVKPTCDPQCGWYRGK